MAQEHPEELQGDKGIQAGPRNTAVPQKDSRGLKEGDSSWAQDHPGGTPRGSQAAERGSGWV